jgi:hypothetical protein
LASSRTLAEERAGPPRTATESSAWCRLKDSRRIATRYDKLARNYLSDVFIAAICAYRIN